MTYVVQALDEFMGAMTRMEEVVMIPSRLKDMEAPLPSPPVRGQHSHPPSRASSSVALSLDAAALGHGPKSAPPSALRPLGPVRAASLDGTGAGAASADLFTYYRMLDTVRHELLSGESDLGVVGHGPHSGSPAAGNGTVTAGLGTDSALGSLGEATDDDLSSLDSEDLRESESARLAATFRQHLNGLYDVMAQLTRTAHLVSDKYTVEVLNARK